MFFSEKSRQKKRKRVQSKRKAFENFMYTTKKQKTCTSSAEDDLFTPTVVEGSLTHELS